MRVWERWFPERRLLGLGILGMNRRNAEYIMRYNPRRFYPLVDDKLQTKRLAMEAGVAVPELYGVVEIQRQIKALHGKLRGYSEGFVVKPAHGSGGEGILVITGRSRGGYRKSSGVLISEEEFEFYVSNILSGLYSLGGLPDCALIERRIDFDPIFANVSYQGVPDIRTIVFRGVPVMAMIRLPTRASDGKANLHQGAVGVGIDLVDGRTFMGTWHESLVEEHPDTGGNIAGLQIPHWETILRLSAACAGLVGLGYIGVDIVLDRKLGPLMLEMNARPGLAIQIANRAGLFQRLRQIDAMASIPATVEERIALAKSIAR
ncbi:alpha-L-glutamate ligase-like protein [Methylohalobius crimeensis]|uniref:alpha-L-glutamate ligase-like protein n=1 Tax=Methylohalobius crimeensis TaxID=244365 RepID=UPI0003B54809|nr:alpha-L-glutamate ligase-like protein [Methylohalobius crimeensis]